MILLCKNFSTFYHTCSNEDFYHFVHPFLFFKFMAIFMQVSHMILMHLPRGSHHFYARLPTLFMHRIYYVIQPFMQETLCKCMYSIYARLPTLSMYKVTSQFDHLGKGYLCKCKLHNLQDYLWTRVAYLHTPPILLLRLYLLLPTVPPSQTAQVPPLLLREG